MANWVLNESGTQRLNESRIILTIQLLAYNMSGFNILWICLLLLLVN